MPQPLTRRVPAVAFLPTNSSATFDNLMFVMGSRLILRSADALSQWILPITDLQGGDAFTSLSLTAAMIDNTSGNYSIRLSLLRGDETGITELVGQEVSCTSTDGISVTDTQAIDPTDPTAIVDLANHTYTLMLVLANSSPTPGIQDLVAITAQYTVQR